MRALQDNIKRAVRHFGSQAKLAKALGCSQQHISYLLTAHSVSVEMAMKIDIATDGAVSRHELRPDFFGPAPTQGEAA